MNQAVVIGSGFGGLASAVRLLKKGYDVTLLEARNQLGGRASVFKKDGYTFDAGPTVITAPYLLNELFELLNEDPSLYYELLPIDPFYRILFNDGSHFDYVGDEERILSNIQRLSARDVDGYRKLAKHAKDIFEIGYTQLADAPFNTVGSMLRTVPDMLRLQNYRSVYSLVSKYIKDERLRIAFSFEPLLVGGNPTKITSIYLLIHWLERKWGVFFCKGGTGTLIEAFQKLLIKKGANIYLNASVNKIEVQNHKVKRVFTADGRKFEADIVVANADPVRVYRDMIAPKNRSKHTDAKLQKKSHSMSLFVAYFGTNKTYEHLAHHTILLGPRYHELLKDIFSRKVLANDFSLYLHAPTRTDPSMAPSGHECFYVLSPVPNQDSKINWKKEEAIYKDKIYRWLEKNCLPELSSSLTVDFSINPDYFENELQSEKGAAFGIEPSLQQSAYFRFHNQSEDIEGLYFVGASTHPGAGVPGVLNSAKVLDRLIPQRKPTASYKSLQHDYLQKKPERIMSDHGKSFYFASLLFSKKQLFRVATLYKLCRFVDDCADELSLVEARQSIDAIIKSLEGEVSDSPFYDLILQVETWGVKRRHLEELVQGARFDVAGETIENRSDLMRYCYRVAGVVGLMMCPLLGVTNQRGYVHAIDLGIAMQLTNICRDIKEDAKLGRVYLPKDKLEKIGCNVEYLKTVDQTPEKLKELISQTLTLADKYYQSAYDGLGYIPLRARIVVLLAGEIYRHIGVKIRHNQFNALQGRVYLSMIEKIGVTIKTFFKMLKISFWMPKAHSARLHLLIQQLPETHR